MLSNRIHEPNNLVGLFVIFWVGSIVVGIILNRRLTAPQKRKWFPRLTIALASFVALFMSAMTIGHSGPTNALPMLLFTACVAGLIAIVTIRQTKYCDKCNATQYNQNLWAPMKFCSRCGAPLDVFKSTSGDDLLA